MPAKIYWLHKFDNNARLAIMARPRGGDWLKDEIIYLRSQKVGILVSLLDRNEIDELGLRNEKEICSEQKIDYINFPISDRDIPAKGEPTDQFINQLANKINEGISIVIHCRMGIGRSSIIAAAVLLKYQFKARDVVKSISSIRGLKVPDTDQQIQWLSDREYRNK